MGVTGISYVGIQMQGSRRTSDVSSTLSTTELGIVIAVLRVGKYVSLSEERDITFARKVLACQTGGGLGAAAYKNVVGDVIWISRWYMHRDFVH